MNATSIYRAIMLECERQRYALGWPMWMVDEKAGTQDNYYAKAVHADAASGRQAQWKTLEWIVGALFAGGFDLIIKPKPGATLADPEALKSKLNALRAGHDGLTQRDRMRSLAALVSKEARAAGRLKIPRKKRREIARKAGRARAEKAQQQRASAGQRQGASAEGSKPAA